MKEKFIVLILMAGILSACGAQATEMPASSPTEEAVPATQAPANSPASTDTALPLEEPAAASAAVSFANDILPIIQSRCVNCHGGERIEEGLVLKSYEEIMAGSDNGPVIVPGDAANSLLVELVENRKMPKRGPKLTPPQVQILVDWVNQGALKN